MKVEFTAIELEILIQALDRKIKPLCLDDKGNKTIKRANNKLVKALKSLFLPDYIIKSNYETARLLFSLDKNK